MVLCFLCDKFVTECVIFCLERFVAGLLVGDNSIDFFECIRGLLSAIIDEVDSERASTFFVSKELLTRSSFPYFFGFGYISQKFCP